MVWKETLVVAVWKETLVVAWSGKRHWWLHGLERDFGGCMVWKETLVVAWSGKRLWWLHGLCLCCHGAQGLVNLGEGGSLPAKN